MIPLERFLDRLVRRHQARQLELGVDLSVCILCNACNVCDACNVCNELGVDLSAGGEVGSGTDVDRDLWLGTSRRREQITEMETRVFIMRHHPSSSFIMRHNPSSSFIMRHHPSPDPKQRPMACVIRRGSSPATVTAVTVVTWVRAPRRLRWLRRLRAFEPRGGYGE